MIDREKVINELVSYIENALSVDSDYVDCIPTDLLQYAVALLKTDQYYQQNMIERLQNLRDFAILGTDWREDQEVIADNPTYPAWEEIHD